MQWNRNNPVLFLIGCVVFILLATRNDHPPPLGRHATNTTPEQVKKTVLWNIRRLRRKLDMAEIDINAFPSYRRKVVTHSPDYLNDLTRQRLVGVEKRLRSAHKQQTDALNEISRTLEHSTHSLRQLRRLRARTLEIKSGVDNVEYSAARELSSMKRFLYSPAVRR